ncbi:MAG: ATP-binding protein [Alphaproteobacteria bacterium]
MMNFKHLMPTGLLGRSLLILVLPVLLIQLVTIAVFVDRHWEKVTGRLSHAVAGEVAVLAAAIEDGRDVGALLTDYARHLSLRVDYARGARLDAAEVADLHAPFEGLFIRTLKMKLADGLGRPFALSVDFEVKRVSIDVQLSEGVLQVSLPERRLFSSSGYVFLLWVFGSSIFLLAISVIFMRNQVRPIRKLAAAAKRFGQGRDVPEFKASGAREVREASRAFVDMHRRIKRQMEQRTMMLAGVSHDLRTPLTRMKLQLSMMEGADAEGMRGDVDAMVAMVDGYLDFVRGEGDEQVRVTDVSALFADVIGRAGAGVVATDIQAGMMLSVRPLSLARCVGNLIDNGLKYGGSVWVSAHVNDDKKLVVFIEDDGPGLTDGQYEDVFKPFYRADESRNVASGGVGLGLSIAQDVVHAHGGRIWMEASEAHDGLKVCIRIPF